MSTEALGRLLKADEKHRPKPPATGRRLKVIVAFVALVLLGWLAWAMIGCAGMDEQRTGEKREAEPNGRPVEVIHPFDNSSADFLGVRATVGNVELAPAAEAAAAGLPIDIPATEIRMAPPDSTDLDLQDMHVSGEITSLWWQDPAVEAADARTVTELEGLSREESHARLPSPDEIAAAAISFAERHGLSDEAVWLADPPRVDVGEALQGSEGDLPIGWVAEWRDPEGPPELAGRVHVRIGASGEVKQLRWDKWRLVTKGEEIVRLRPVDELADDPEAWRAGDVFGGLEGVRCLESGSDLDLRVVGLSLELIPVRNVEHEAARFAVPVYDFEVEITAPEQHAGATGVWRVVAARDVVR